VLLIDRSSFHIWKPTLHEVAAGTLDVHQEGISYSILGRSNGFNFLLGELEAFDPTAKRLTLKAIAGENGERSWRRSAPSASPMAFWRSAAARTCSARPARSRPTCWSAPRTPKPSMRACWRPSPRPHSRPRRSCASPLSVAARPGSSCRPS
jgi:hypothetical protein